jgi:hypothetical protein
VSYLVVCKKYIPPFNKIGNLLENFVHRITRWIDEEEERIEGAGKTSLQYVIMDMTGKLLIKK